MVEEEVENKKQLKAVKERAQFYWRLVETESSQITLHCYSNGQRLNGIQAITNLVSNKSLMLFPFYKSLGCQVIPC